MDKWYKSQNDYSKWNFVNFNLGKEDSFEKWNQMAHLTNYALTLYKQRFLKDSQD